MKPRSAWLLWVGVMSCTPGAGTTGQDAGTDREPAGSGGVTGSGGNTGLGGSTGTAGASVSSGGITGSGGATASGGGSATGGSNATGGTTSTGGSNGAGGVAASGGRAGSAGASGGTGSGGSPALGGATASGGRGGSAGAAAGGSGTGGGSLGGAAPASTFAVVTNRYDNARSGANTSETILTTANVNRTQFGLLFSRTINGYVYGQPLYVGGLTINGVKRNVVYVATQHNMVYAFDADAATPDAPLWSRMLGAPLVLGSGGYDPGCTDMRNEVGITSTPVISLADNKIYVVAKVTGAQNLHALDLATGADAAGSPVAVGSMSMAAFDARIHLNRAALLLVNGVIYMGFGSHCDAGAYHGWVFGYDAKTLQFRSVYSTSPTGNQGAIWQSGVGLTSDGTSIWATVGNGSIGGDNVGNHVIRLTPSGSGMTIAARHASRISGDNDLQSGVTILGNTGQIVGGGKDGDILLLDQTTLALRQMVGISGELNQFVFWNGSAGAMLYAWPAGQVLHSYLVGSGTLQDRGTNGERRPQHPSGIFTISSNGATAGTGILWANIPLVGDAWHATATGALYAFDAADVTKASLWNSTLNAADNLGTYAKYSPPMVANGKVYIATFAGKLQVYGLK